MAKAKKRIGRPVKLTPKGKRVSLGLKVTAEIKRLIDQEAEKSGRTQSQVAELLIERALQYDRTLQAMNTTLADMEKGNVETTLRRMGYTPVHDTRGKIWREPGYQGAKRSGFVSEDDE